jgi:hypothetical protein
MITKILNGSCECGKVKYTVLDEFSYAANCHCSLCRRATGSAFKSFAGIERDKISVIAGEEALMIVGKETGHHARCGTCGSFLYSVVRDGAFVHVAMGSLIDTPTIQPNEHIFVGSKAKWFTITDDLPQFDAFPI